MQIYGIEIGVGEELGGLIEMLCRDSGAIEAGKSD